jgi:solute:Na+ symporter, SSS family
MRLSTLDWVVMALFFVVSVGLGMLWGRRAKKNLTEFFVSGRDVPWWLAGTSMVATTFSADTPLAVTGLVVAHGVAGNWLWWNAVASGILTVFFFASLWRRAGVLTDVELVEIRYAGKAAAALRGFRAVYLALPINCIILGWVNLAMAKILGLTVGIPKGPATAACMVLTGLYVSVSGLWGVLVADVIQFAVMMFTTIALAVYSVRAAGGIDGIRAVIPDERLSVVPPIDAAWMPGLALAVYLGVQWWAAWYPGAEPGGGGYVAQRIFSARTERDGVLATLWFNVAHYCIRSWPWILTALSACVLYPGLRDGSDHDPEGAYVRIMIDHLPPSLRGLMMAGFVAAYMSTVATHLNWGASYLVRDLYARFVRPNETDAHYVNASRVATLATMVCAGFVTMQLQSIEGAWKLLISMGAGTGLVLILRWYWWRINAWSEVSAMIASLVATVVLRYGFKLDADNAMDFAKIMLGTLAFCTVVWVTVTFATPPEPMETLKSFYTRVRPAGNGWAAIAKEVGMAPLGPTMAVRARDWVLGCAMIYLTLFGVGKVLLHDVGAGSAMLAGAAVCAVLLWRDLSREEIT